MLDSVFFMGIRRVCNEVDECSDIKYFSPEQLNYSAATLAMAISQDLDDDTVSILGSFFSAVGTMLILTAKQRALIKACCTNQTEEKK